MTPDLKGLLSRKENDECYERHQKFRLEKKDIKSLGFLYFHII